MPQIESVSAIEILDSRGRPTVLAEVTFSSDITAQASVPSGASTGAAEALELRDGDPSRYRGLGCRKAVANVNSVISDALCGHSFDSQDQLDNRLLELDGTDNKRELGANAILAVSIAYARAMAAERGKPLHSHFADVLGHEGERLPRLTVNLFSGGKHAGGQVPIQDVLIVPASAKTIDEGLATIWAVYQAAADMCLSKYQTRALSADEGGLAPPFTSLDEMFEDTIASIKAAGFEPGRDVAIAVDVASSHFYVDGKYEIEPGSPIDSAGMIDTISQWVDKYPIVSVEDGLSEDDWENWPALRESLSGKAITLGDDFLCTNPKRIERAIDANACDALLLKVNQIGCLTEAAEAYRLARDAGWRITISARSGETEDNWLADLAVGWRGDQIKIGSITQSERLAKYNRLLEIEAEQHLEMCDWPSA